MTRHWHRTFERIVRWLKPSAERFAAAAAVSACTSKSPIVLPDVGHLAQLDDPDALATALRGAETLALQRRPDGDHLVLAPRRGDHLESHG